MTLDGMQFSFMKPPYMNFEDHIQVKRKLKETFTQQEILLIHFVTLRLSYSLFTVLSCSFLGYLVVSLFGGVGVFLVGRRF